MACDQPCAHCGSLAGSARQDELDVAEALKVVAQLADMKARAVVLIGGEAYLYDGFWDVISALKEVGIRPVMTTGGRILTAANTHINRVNAPVLEELYELLRGYGIKSWQVQITVPLGRAAE